MHNLRKLLIEGDESVPLDQAALGLAAFEFPGLDPAPFLEILDSYARELSVLCDPQSSGQEFVEAAGHYFFHDLAFRGNQSDYYNPRNSCLNEVLADRAGIPITLSVVYLAVAHRLGRPVHGVGLPGHFLVRYDDGNYSAFIDPFHEGRILSMAQCRDLALEVAHVDIYAAPSAMAPVSSKQILLRMLGNLRNAYYRRQQFAKAIPIMDLLIESDPDAGHPYKERGVLHLNERHLAPALRDLLRYLELTPQAPDREQVLGQVEELRRYLRTLQ